VLIGNICTIAAHLGAVRSPVSEKPVCDPEGLGNSLPVADAHSNNVGNPITL
jgi:hypothetical protein